MSTNGLSSSNDIEMVLQAFIENRMQYFYADDQRNKEGVYLSKAIKNPIIVYVKYVEAIKKNIYLIWNGYTDTWMVKYSIPEMEDYIKDYIKT
jgi:hypothetical protein